MNKDKILADWSGHAESEWMRKYGDPFTDQAKLIFFEGFRSAMERTLQILTANEQEDEKVHNIHCPECGEFIGVGLLMYNPNASKPYDPHEVED